MEEVSKRLDRFANFNCTIQELKPTVAQLWAEAKEIFQLHHTGIKTRDSYEISRIMKRFQLHHTGIKTFNQGGRYLAVV